MTATKHGRCLCGAISFSFTAKPNWTAYCHCESCRRNTGSPVTAFVGVPNDSFQWTQAEPEIFASSPGVRRSFCGNCGTPMAYEAEAFPGEIHLYLATLDEPNALAPRGHVHAGAQLDWFEVDDDLPRFAAGGGSGQHPVRVGPRRRRQS